MFGKSTWLLSETKPPLRVARALSSGMVLLQDILHIKRTAVWNAEHRPMDAYLKKLLPFVAGYRCVDTCSYFVAPHVPSDANSERFFGHRYHKETLLKGTPNVL